MSANSERVKLWRRRLKTRLVEGFGGKCGVCEYNRTQNALEFHHLDPNEKDFTLSKARNLKWEVFVEEAKKCVLLCANCHREVHDDLLVLPHDIQRFDESLVTYEKYETLKGNQNSKRKDGGQGGTRTLGGLTPSD
jgi:NAD-dependent dihydropyrimidine dehydrogenase PreA subunit